MNPDTQAQARAAILSACATETMNMKGILSNPDVKPLVEEHGEWDVKQLVYALARSGLLFSRGQRAGKLYRTSAEGRQFIS